MFFWAIFPKTMPRMAPIRNAPKKLPTAQAIEAMANGSVRLTEAMAELAVRPGPGGADPGGGG